MILTRAKRISLRDSLPLHLILFLLPHSMNLLLKELQLFSITFAYLILLPFLVFPAFLEAASVYVEAGQVLHQLQLVVEVKVSVGLPTRALMVQGQVLETGTV